jgi:beta-lactam-binding protein with PASTA domain
MRLKELITHKIFLKNAGLAVLITAALIWFTMIMLSIYTNKGENFPTPDFKGLTISKAEELANTHNLRFITKDSVYRKDVPPGTVVFQNPSAGHKIKPNRLIYITLSSFLPEQVEIPKLTDVSFRHAEELLESKGFALGSIIFRPSEFEDLVLEQKYNGLPVAPGTRLDNGSTIDLVVGKKMTGGETTIPDLKSLTLIDAQNILNNKSLMSGVIIYDTDVQTAADSLNAMVWKQLPQPDSTSLVMSGLSVDLWLKLKSEPVDTTIQ